MLVVAPKFVRAGRFSLGEAAEVLESVPNLLVTGATTLPSLPELPVLGMCLTCPRGTHLSGLGFEPGLLIGSPYGKIALGAGLVSLALVVGRFGKGRRR